MPSRDVRGAPLRDVSGAPLRDVRAWALTVVTCRQRVTMAWGSQAGLGHQAGHPTDVYEGRGKLEHSSDVYEAAHPLDNIRT